MKILTPSSFYKNIAGYHLLLDTSFFIDSTNHKTEFSKFVTTLKSYNITLVTIDPVKAEFTKGAENKEKLAAKKKLIDDIVDSTLPLTSDTMTNHLHHLIENYYSKAKGLSITDMLLGATLQKHTNDLLLVTKNPKDFPKPLTKLKTYFLMDLDKGLQTYAFLEKTN